ncbi:MAG: hypothetical protein ABSF53_15710 [Terracidiphilus sp.]|jgi:hypothetical protein
MRTTIDIPDELLKDAKRKALEEDTTLRQLVIEGLKLRSGVAKGRQRIEFPIIRSKNPGTLNLTNEQVYDILDSDLVDSAGH